MPFSSIASVQAKDLYTRYAASLYGYIITRVPEEKQASQILHDSFVYAIHHLYYYDDKKLKIFSWLMQIVIRKTAAYITSIECGVPNRQMI